MDAANPPNDDTMFKMLLLGLMWLRVARPDILARRGASVYGTFHAAQLISEGRRLSVSGNGVLISLIMRNSQIIKVSRVPNRSDLLRMCERSDQPLIMIVKPAGASVQFDRIVGPKGYLLVITDLGIQMAGEAAAEFSELIDAASFEAAWQRYKARMGAIGAARKRQNAAAARPPTGYHSLTAGSDAELAARLASMPAKTEDDDW